jgi:hypothetical protein
VNGLLIWIGVIVSLQLLVSLSHAGATQRLLNLALGNRGRFNEPPQGR